MMWDLPPDPVLLDRGKDVNNSQLEGSVGMCAAVRSLSPSVAIGSLEWEVSGAADCCLLFHSTLKKRINMKKRSRF